MTERPLWLSGFGAFPGVPDNPTSHIAEALQGERFGDAYVTGRVLDVSYARAPAQLQESLAQLTCPPRAVVLLGVARKASYVRVERVARNVPAGATPDVDGLRAAPWPEDPPGLELLTTVDVDGLARSLTDAGYDARVSQDAGDYLCNYSYYHALRQAQSDDTPALFVHIPPVGARVNQRLWSLETLTAAVRHALTWLTNPSPEKS